MDVTTTAQVIQTAQGILAQAQAGGISPDKLVISAGILCSHVAGGFADKIPVSIRPAAIALGSAVITAGAAVSSGSDWKTALGYGIGSAAIGKLYHVAILKPDSLLAGIIKAFTNSTTAKS